MVDTSGFWIIVSDNNSACKEAQEILINQRYDFKITNIKSITLDDYFIFVVEVVIILKVLTIIYR